MVDSEKLKLKVVTVVGARPQFIKSSAISRVINETPRIEEIIVHSGQHFDQKMSDVFFEELRLSKPNYHLDINQLSHGAMTGRMLEKVESVLVKEQPSVVLVYGDTNTTLAGALAAKKLHIPIAHVEAGLRSYNYKMPEEWNRILVDRMSDMLFCPTERSRHNLLSEGFGDFPATIDVVGDVMYDSFLFYKRFSESRTRFNPGDERFALLTIHREENTNSKLKLSKLVDSLNKLHRKINLVCPLHPRTRDKLKTWSINADFKIIDPLGYLDMIAMLLGCYCVVTDSGGLQKEAYFAGKPCITLRDESEWLELLDLGVNVLVGSDEIRLMDAFEKITSNDYRFMEGAYGTGNAARDIVQKLLTNLV